VPTANPQPIRSITQHAVAGGAAYLAFSVLLTAGHAQAAFTRYVSTISCNGLVGSVSGGSQIGWYNTQSTYIDSWCPIPSDTNMVGSSITGVNVRGKAIYAGGNVYVQACSSYYDTTGGTCSASKTATPNGYHEWSVGIYGSDLGAFAPSGYSEGFPYVHVSLPPQGAVNGIMVYN